jgi:hypothetical protein
MAIGSLYEPTYDLSLAKIHSQFSSQLAQREAGIQTEQDFQTFMSGTMQGLLDEQNVARGKAQSHFSDVLQPAFMNTLGGVMTKSAGLAQETEANLAGDPARQAAVGTIRQAASGEGISGFAEHLTQAGGVRGEEGMVAPGLEGELALLSQEAAAPVAYGMELQDILRPFQTQTTEAGTMAQIAETQSGMVKAQAGSLAALTEFEASPVGVLAGMYGGSAGAFKDPSGSQSAIDALFADPGYVNPVPRFW